ncbi:MAG TPA: hypothetical protein VH950_18385 [Gaiellaceae bacterium]
MIALCVGIGLVLVSVPPLALHAGARSRWVEEGLVVTSGAGAIIAFVAFAGLVVGA